MEEKTYRGVLTQAGGKAFILGINGEKYFDQEPVWSGYLKHFNGKNIFARRLPQRDYESGSPIIIMWPDEQFLESPCVDLYYNERLVKYPASLLGHVAINVDGEIFNFSHLLNENEIMKIEEYFYRPALGEFAPHPVTKIFNADDPRKPYYDKFGRLFMRTIHVLRIKGIDVQKLSAILKEALRHIFETPVNPKNPMKYRDFNIFTHSCTTIIRDGLKKYGFSSIRGTFPGDFFTNAAYYFIKHAKKLNVSARVFRLAQLKVNEAPYSRKSPLLNPMNRFRKIMIARTGR